MVFRPFYVQKEFLRKILSLPDFEIRDSDDTQTIILENIIRSSGTFFISGGYLRTVVTCRLLGFQAIFVVCELYYSVANQAISETFSRKVLQPRSSDVTFSAL